MRATTVAGLAAVAMLVAAAGSTAAEALPIEPSAIAKADAAASNVVDVQWRRGYGYRGRYWGGYRGRYWGPRYYGGYYPRYYGGYYPYYGYGYPYYARPYIGGFGFGIGYGGLRFGVW
jgi:hypothetical protein